MKGFLVANRINDIYFMDNDEEFARHVNKQAFEQGLINELNEDESNTLEVNVVMQLFSPIFMSQWFMIDQRKNPCKSITCENGFVFVFQHIEDLLIVAINGDNTESEDYLTRKTCVFVRMVEFLFGPVTDEIGHSKFSDKQNRWYLLKGIMNTWNTLSLEEHAFLVEAIERVQINMIVNERCVDVLDHAVNRLQNAGEKNTYHGLLFVNSKLLTLYSGRNAPELRSSDTLAIILLIKHLFPTDEKLEDLFSCSYRKTDPVSSQPFKTEYHRSPTSDKYESAPDDMEEDEDKYASAVESPIPDKGSDSDVPYPEMSITDAKPSYHISNAPSRTPTPEMLNRAANVSSTVGRQRSRTFDGDQTGGVAGVSKQIIGSGRARSQSWVEPTCEVIRATPPELGTKTETPPIPEEVKTIPFYQSHTVFLQNELCTHCPHQLHCIQVFPGITLILVSEMPRARVANTLCQILFLLKQLVLGRIGLGPWAQGQNMYDTINSLINKLAVPLKRAKGSIAAIFSDVLKKWDDPDFKSLLLNFLDKPRDTDIPPNIERSLAFLLKKMKDLFVFLYLLPRGVSIQMEKAVSLIRERAGIKLRDFKDYLSVKAQRNITMTSYIQQFPGLIHFVYIDRRTNQVTAPSFNIMSGEINGMDATRLLKDKVWKMMEFMQLKLRNGITCVAVRDGDYYFSYFLWFGDSTGSIITPQNPINVSVPLASPGVLSSNFYSILLRRCFPNVIPGSVACFELMMMHIGLVSLSLITDHRTMLTAVLRNSSGESISPVTLAYPKHL